MSRIIQPGLILPPLESGDPWVSITTEDDEVLLTEDDEEIITEDS